MIPVKNITKKRKALTDYRSPIYQTDLVVDEEFTTIFVQVAEVNKWIPKALVHAAHISNANGNIPERKRIAEKVNGTIQAIEKMLQTEIDGLSTQCDDLGLDPSIH